MSYQPRRTIGPRRKWNSLRAANRIPEVELERKVAEINRHRAVSKREMLVEEGRLWSEMFENHKVLRTSIARYPEQEVIRRLILVEKDNAIDEPQPYSECKLIKCIVSMHYTLTHSLTHSLTPLSMYACFDVFVPTPFLIHWSYQKQIDKLFVDLAVNVKILESFTVIF